MNHAPNEYVCPFCDWLAGRETEYKQNSDIVLQDEYITAFVSPKWWINNPGHVIVIPNQHVENVYEIDDETLAHVAVVTKRLAHAIRVTYPTCTGTSMRQHNEPDGATKTSGISTLMYSLAIQMMRYMKTMPTSVSSHHQNALRTPCCYAIISLTNPSNSFIPTYCLMYVVFFTQTFFKNVIDTSGFPAYYRGSS